MAGLFDSRFWSEKTPLERVGGFGASETARTRGGCTRGGFLGGEFDDVEMGGEMKLCGRGGGGGARPGTTEDSLLADEAICTLGGMAGGVLTGSERDGEEDRARLGGAGAVRGGIAGGMADEGRKGGAGEGREDGIGEVRAGATGAGREGTVGGLVVLAGGGGRL